MSRCPASAIAAAACVAPYKNTGIWPRSKEVPLLPNWNYAICEPMITNVFYTYDKSEPLNKTRYRVHRPHFGGDFGFYILESKGFVFRPVPTSEIRVVTDLGKSPVMYADFIREYEKEEAERAALREARRKRKEAAKLLEEAAAIERKFA